MALSSIVCFCQITRHALASFFLIAAVVVATTRDCYHVISSGNGTLSSPNYPRNYSSNTHCTWDITVSSSFIILFKLEDIDIEYDEKCAYDKLLIQEKKGVKFKTSATFCGSNRNSFSTKANIARIVFTSDGSENRRGFKLKWKAVKPVEGCGKTEFNNTVGSLSSPGYPNVYASRLNCTYQLNVPAYSKMVIEIQDIDIEYESACQYDALTIYDGGMSTAAQIGKFCGNKLPSRGPVLNGPVVFIRFTSDASTGGRGFNFTWITEKSASRNESRKCGQKQHFTRIVGGVFARRGEFPWQAAFFWKTGIARGMFFCGGALIDSQWVVTAAHCFVNGRDAALYKVILGDHRINVTEKGQQEFNISEIIVHKNYSTITYDNDIALVKLHKKAIYNDYVNSLCLPTGEILHAGTRCQIAGWGAISQNGPISNVLLKAEVPVIHRSICSHVDVYGSKITENMLCAGYAIGGVDTCQGDSGGPLSCRKSGDSERWELSGIASWGRGCGRRMKYGVYTNAQNYIAWIQNNIASHNRTRDSKVPYRQSSALISQSRDSPITRKTRSSLANSSTFGNNAVATWLHVTRKTITEDTALVHSTTWDVGIPSSASSKDQISSLYTYSRKGATCVSVKSSCHHNHVIPKTEKQNIKLSTTKTVAAESFSVKTEYIEDTPFIDHSLKPSASNLHKSKTMVTTSSYILDRNGITALTTEVTTNAKYPVISFSRYTVRSTAIPQPLTVYSLRTDSIAATISQGNKYYVMTNYTDNILTVAPSRTSRTATVSHIQLNERSGSIRMNNSLIPFLIMITINLITSCYH